LKDAGCREPERSHIAQTQALLWSERPSAKITLPGGVTVARNYGKLEIPENNAALCETMLPCPGSVALDGLRITCMPAQTIENTPDTFTVYPRGTMVLRSRMAGDSIRLPGGTKSLKKLFIDKKIPAAKRLRIPVLADDAGVLGVYTIGADMCRRAEGLPAVQIRFEKEKTEE